MVTKISVSMDENLLKKIDDYVSKNYTNRSNLISQLCAQYLDQVKAMEMMDSLIFALNKIADKGEIDEDSKRQLDDFERLVKMIRR